MSGQSTRGAQVEEMSFCRYACFPQVPTVAAVRIALTEKNGVYYDIGRISEDDDRAFWFCEANGMSLSSNARLCARQLSASLGHNSLLELIFETKCADELDRAIIEVLISMCLARVPVSKREVLERELRALPVWDRHKVAGLLATALTPSQDYGGS